jgi:hypothetical protein
VKVSKIYSINQFTVGDLFVRYNDVPFGYLTEIYQEKKGMQYHYIVKPFKSGLPDIHLNTIRLKDKIDYGNLKHYRVVKP